MARGVRGARPDSVVLRNPARTGRKPRRPRPGLGWLAGCLAARGSPPQPSPVLGGGFRQQRAAATRHSDSVCTVQRDMLRESACARPVVPCGALLTPATGPDTVVPAAAAASILASARCNFAHHAPHGRWRANEQSCLHVAFRALIRFGFLRVECRWKEERGGRCIAVRLLSFVRKIVFAMYIRPKWRARCLLSGWRSLLCFGG